MQFLEDLDNAALSFQSVEMADDANGMESMIDLHDRLHGDLMQQAATVVTEEARQLQSRLGAALTAAREDGGMAAEQRLWLSMDDATTRLMQHSGDCHVEV